MTTNTMILAGASCMCAFFTLLIIGGVGYFLMKKKGNADAETAGSEQAPPEAIPDPTATTSSPIATAGISPGEALEPDPEPEPETESAPKPEPESLPEPIEDSGLVAPPEPIPTPMVEPLQTPDIDDIPAPASPDVSIPIIEEQVPDPSAIAGLDSPIVAADTLDEDEAESPTVIIPRDRPDEEDA